MSAPAALARALYAAPGAGRPAQAPAQALDQGQMPDGAGAPVMPPMTPPPMQAGMTAPPMGAPPMAAANPQMMAQALNPQPMRPPLPMMQNSMARRGLFGLGR